MRNIPTLEEFKEQVETMFMEHWSSLSKEEAMAYLYQDNTIKTCYENAKEKFLNGEITLEQFMTGETSSLAYLFIMDY